MGLNDAAEQLASAQAQSVRDEREIAELRVTLEGMTRQNAELEHDLARAESDLADRLQHDAHVRPAAHTIDRAAVTETLQALAADAAEPHYALNIEGRVDEILGLLQPADGILLTAEDAALAVRACLHSAESIRFVLETDPTHLHPGLAPYVTRLTDLADRLQAGA